MEIDPRPNDRTPENNDGAKVRAAGKERPPPPSQLELLTPAAISQEDK